MSNPDAGDSTESLEETVARLNKTVADLVTVIESGGLQPDSDPSAPPKHYWRLNAIPDPVKIDSWVEYMNRVYTRIKEPILIPACWANHEGLKAEVGTLYGAWRAGFTNKDATALDGQNFHDRWLPGFMTRVPWWIYKSCLEGDCPHDRQPAGPTP